MKISASLALALAARTAAQRCADSAGTHLPLSAALPAPFALLSLALLVLICLNHSFKVMGLGRGRSVWWHVVPGEKSLFYNSISFSPTLLLLLQLLSFQELLRTRQPSKWVCANTAF